MPRPGGKLIGASLDWDRRFSNRRQRGVGRFWSEERKRPHAGEEGTRDWSPEQADEIMKNKRPKFYEKTIEGHHMYNALDYPHLADKALNIYPATRDEHLYRWHGGSFQNETKGKPLNPLIPEDF